MRYVPLNPSLASGRAVKLFAGLAAPRNYRCSPANDNLNQFEFCPRWLRTYVCFLWVAPRQYGCWGGVRTREFNALFMLPRGYSKTVAFAPSVTPETNRALQYVNLHRSQEERVSAEIRATRQYSDLSTHAASRWVRQRLTHTASSRTAGQTRTQGLNT